MSNICYLLSNYYFIFRVILLRRRHEIMKSLNYGLNRELAESLHPHSEQRLKQTSGSLQCLLLKKYAIHSLIVFQVRQQGIYVLWNGVIWIWVNDKKMFDIFFNFSFSDGAVNMKPQQDNTMKTNIFSHIRMFWWKRLGSPSWQHIHLLEPHRMVLCLVSAAALAFSKLSVLFVLKILPLLML